MNNIYSKKEPENDTLEDNWEENFDDSGSAEDFQESNPIGNQFGIFIRKVYRFKR